MADIMNLDAILAEATPPEVEVRLCLNGRLRREYETLKEQIDERREAAEKAAAAAGMAAAANTVVDERLGVKTKPAVPADVARDPEQDRLDQLVEKMKARTVLFVLRALPEQQWGELMEAPPPRKDPATGRIIPQDAKDLVNTSTFYPVLVRRSVVEPVLDEDRYAKVVKNLSRAQWARLAQAAADVNTQDDDLPF